MFVCFFVFFKHNSENGRDLEVPRYHERTIDTGLVNEEDEVGPVGPPVPGYIIKTVAHTPITQHKSQLAHYSRGPPNWI